MPQPTLAEVFAAHWPGYVERHRPHLAAAHYRAARAILACRTPERGMVRRVCVRCGAAHLAPLSCGHRACPQCGTAQARQWEARRAAKLLPVPHFLVTLTVPEELRGLLHGRAGYGAMFAASTVAMRQSVGAHLGGEPGWTAVLHTWTRQLARHPHLHLIVAGCAVTHEGARREVCRGDYLVPGALLAARWRDALLAALRHAASTDPKLEAALAGVPPETWTRRWVVDVQPVGRGETALRYLARYVQKTALDHARLLRLDAGSVSIGWRERPQRPGERRGLPRRTRLDPDLFLRRFLAHVLPSGFQRVRHGGFYSAAARERYARLAALLGHSPPRPIEDPWQPGCPHCGGAMQVTEIHVGRVVLIPRRFRVETSIAPIPAITTLERAP
jgi:hypothetical protein